MLTQADLHQPLSSLIPSISSQEYAATRGYSQDEVALVIVDYISLLFKEKGFEVTKDGRKILRDAIRYKLKNPSILQVEDDRNTVADEASQIVELSIRNGRDTFENRYTRVGYVVAGNIVKLLERIAQEIRRCPAWPFC